MSERPKKILISGGGSGGHIFPAIAIADTLKNKWPDAEFLFVGAQDKIEMEKVPKAGYPIEGLWISGFHRKLTLRNLLFPIKLIASIWKARQILKRFKPDVVIGVGGFASGPTLKMATRLKIPTLIQEQNSYPGVTNKLLAKEVNKICVAYENTDRFFPKNKIVLTGNPVRQDLVDLKNTKEEGCLHFGLDPNRPVVLLFGGSLGARTFNQAMRDNKDLLEMNKEIQFIWQAGKLYEADYGKTASAQLPNVRFSAFLDRMDLAYACADVIICRAGALTISELCLVGKPAILIPSPNVAEDHQTHNARALVDKGAALMVKDQAANEQMIPRALALLEDLELRKKISQAVLLLAKPQAAEKIAAQISELVSNPKAFG